MVHSSHDAEGQRVKSGNGGTNEAWKAGEEKCMSQSPNDGGPAFASPSYYANPGMSLLDYFAGQALAGLIGQELSYERMAEVCYR